MKGFFSLIVFGLHLHLLAQTNYTFKWGAEEKNLPDIGSYFWKTYTPTEGLFALRSEKALLYPDYFLYHISDDLNEISNGKIEIGAHVGYEFLADLAVENSNLFIFTTRTEKKDKELIFSVQPVDKSTLELNGTRQDLVASTFKSAFLIGAYSYVRENGYYLVIYREGTIKNKKVVSKFKLTMLDNQFQKKWEQIFELPYSATQFGWEDFSIYEDGSVGIVSGVRFKDGGLFNRNINYHYMRIGSEGAGFKDFSIPVVDKEVRQFRWDLSSSDKFICFGIIPTNEGKRSNFIIEMDTRTGEVLNESYIDYNPPVPDNEDPDIKELGDEEKDNFDLYNRDFVSLSNGDMIFFDEYSQDFHSRFTRIYDTWYGSRESTVYEYKKFIRGNITVTRRTPDGNTIWRQQILKDQRFDTQFYVIRREKTMIILFYDHHENKGLEGPVKKCKSAKDGVVVAIEMTYDGKILGKEQILTNDEAGGYFDFNSIFKIDENTYMVRSNRGTRSRLGRLYLN